MYKYLTIVMQLLKEETGDHAAKIDSECERMGAAGWEFVGAAPRYFYATEFQVFGHRVTSMFLTFRKLK